MEVKENGDFKNDIYVSRQQNKMTQRSSYSIEQQTKIGLEMGQS